MIRNNEGVVFQAGARNLQRLTCALHAETTAVLRSVEWALQFGMSCIILEIDAALLGEGP